MQTLKPILPLLALTYLLALSSCDGVGCGGNYSFSRDNIFAFNILDKNTKQNILQIGQINYNYDTVKIYHENWEVAYPGPVPGDGLIVLRFIDGDKDKGLVNLRILRKYFMYFNYQEIDTIDIAFEMRYGECHFQKMKYFKVAYNDSVYFDRKTERVYGENFLK